MYLIIVNDNVSDLGHAYM